MDTRPNIIFSEDGLCPPCQYQSKPQDIDWNSRAKELEDIITFAKQNNQSGYDCIVGVSGGKDSTRQAMHIRDNFGLKPLMVSMNYPPEQISQRGVDNLGNLIATCVSSVKLGFSLILSRYFCLGAYDNGTFNWLITAPDEFFLITYKLLKSLPNSATAFLVLE